MIEIDVKVVGIEAVRAKFDRMPAEVHARLLRTIQGLGIELQRKVMSEKLSGQVLNVRTGRLRRSITEATTDEGDRITSRTGTNVTYAKVWELGFTGDVKVRAHQRTVSKVFGKSVTPFQQHVGAHSRHVKLAARPFLAPSLDEMRARVRDRIAAAVGEGL